MFHSRAEGQKVEPGFNYTRTRNGHGVALVLKWFNEHMIAVGYYWGIQFHWRYAKWRSY